MLRRVYFVKDNVLKRNKYSCLADESPLWTDLAISTTALNVTVFTALVPTEGTAVTMVLQYVCVCVCTRSRCFFDYSRKQFFLKYLCWNKANQS